MKDVLYTREASSSLCATAMQKTTLCIERNGDVYYFRKPTSKPVLLADLLDFLEKEGIEIWIEPVNVQHEGFKELGTIRQYRVHICKGDRVASTVVSQKWKALEEAIKKGIDLINE